MSTAAVLICAAIVGLVLAFAIYKAAQVWTLSIQAKAALEEMRYEQMDTMLNRIQEPLAAVQQSMGRIDRADGIDLTPKVGEESELTAAAEEAVRYIDEELERRGEPVQ